MEDIVSFGQKKTWEKLSMWPHSKKDKNLFEANLDLNRPLTFVSIVEFRIIRRLYPSTWSRADHVNQNKSIKNQLVTGTSRPSNVNSSVWD